jgi:hypothetical protein
MSDNVFFFRPKRPTASSSSQSTTSSTFSTLPQSDRRRAQGGRGHAPALRLVRPRPLSARSPPSPMRRAGGQWREPLLLEEEHELDRDHREQPMTTSVAMPIGLDGYQELLRDVWMQACGEGVLHAPFDEHVGLSASCGVIVEEETAREQQVERQARQR